MKIPETIEELFQYFKSKPSKLWITGHIKDGKKYCAIGWLKKDGFIGSNSKAEKPFLKLLKKAFNNKEITYINDGLDGNKRYGKTPKKRILNFLREQIKKEKQ